MALSKITFENKQTLVDLPSVAEVNKCTASNINEIKSVVNNNVDELKNKITETIYTGTLKGTETTTLSGVKNKLIIYAMCNGANIVYTMDVYYTSAQNHASGMQWAYDTASGLEFYVSEGNYNASTGVFTHARAGYVNIGTGTYTARNSINTYFIYKIETCD